MVEPQAKLLMQLIAAGLPITGLDTKNAPVWSVAPSVPQQTQAATIIAAFDPTPTADDKADLAADGMPKIVMAALIVVMAARLSNQTPPLWSINTLNDAAAKILAARSS